MDWNMPSFDELMKRVAEFFAAATAAAKFLLVCWRGWREASQPKAHCRNRSYAEMAAEKEDQGRHRE